MISPPQKAGDALPSLANLGEITSLRTLPNLEIVIPSPRGRADEEPFYYH